MLYAGDSGPARAQVLKVVPLVKVPQKFPYEKSPFLLECNPVIHV